MNLRALASADPDTPMRQRNCGAVPVGDQVEIRIKDGSAYALALLLAAVLWRPSADLIRFALATPAARKHYLGMIPLGIAGVGCAGAPALRSPNSRRKTVRLLSPASFSWLCCR